MTPTPRAKSDANTASGLGIDVRALLDRPEIVVDPAAADESLKDRVVFVTGAAGSIGSAIARRVAERGPRALVLIDRSENELYRLGQELEERARGVDRKSVV